MLIERGALRQVRPRLVAGAGPRAADAGQRARGHRQPGRPARRRPTGAVLLAAAVVGMQFWPGAVAAALGRPVETVERALRRLEQRDFVHEQTDVDDGRPAGVPVPARARARRLLPAAAAHRAGRPARAHRRLARRAVAAAGTPTWPRCSPTTGGPRTRSPVRSALDADRYAPAARDGPAPGGPARVRPARPGRRGHPRGRALSAVRRRDRPRLDRLRLELLATEISFYARRRRASSPAAASSSSPALAERLYAGGDHGRRGPGLDAARPGRLAARRPGRRRWPAWTGRSSCSTTCRTAPEKADAYAELGRLHMLNYERDPAIAAAGAAAEIAERLGLVEVQANARITIGTARYQAGDRAGLDELHDVTEFCREHGLLALRRADAEPRVRAARGGRLAALGASCWPKGAATVPGGQSADHRVLRRGDAGLLRRRLRQAARPPPTPSWTPRPAGGTCRSGACGPACACCAAPTGAGRAGRRRRRRRARARPRQRLPPAALDRAGA